MRQTVRNYFLPKKHNAKYYLDWMNHSVFDDYWKQFSPKLHYSEIKAPAMNVSGLYDIFVTSTLRNYRGMRDHGGSENARKDTRVIMGPWTHMDFSGKLNEFDFGPESGENNIGLINMKIDWYNHWLEAKLFVSSDCRDTDFTVKLTDMDENGVSRLLSDGILRMRYRNSMEKTELMEPGKIYEITVDVAATANTFLKGHKIRVSVSSSNFPRFNRNTNTGGSIFFETEEEYRKAENVLYHDADHPSCIILPVVKKQQN